MRKIEQQNKLSKGKIDETRIDKSKRTEVKQEKEKFLSLQREKIEKKEKELAEIKKKLDWIIDQIENNGGAIRYMAEKGQIVDTPEEEEIAHEIVYNLEEKEKEERRLATYTGELEWYKEMLEEAQPEEKANILKKIETCNKYIFTLKQAIELLEDIIRKKEKAILLPRRDRLLVCIAEIESAISHIGAGDYHEAKERGWRR